MKYAYLLISILSLLIISSCSKAQIRQLKFNKTGTPAFVNAPGKPNIVVNQDVPPIDSIQVPFLLFGLESNSGGQALNADATPTELDVRPGVKILNNALLVLQDLDIGTNNLLQHNGMVNPELKHSWELELANMQAAGSFGADPIYIAKTGQGGTRITQWGIGSSFRNLIFTRANKMIQLLSITQVPKFAMFYSQGINDVIAVDWNATAWRDSTISLINNIRATYPDIPIVMQKFWPITGKDVTGLNAAIDYIVTTLPKMGAIESDYSDLDDVYHDGYNSKKENTRRFVAKLRQMGYKL